MPSISFFATANTMNVHFVIHEAFEAPGAYETWVRDRGHTATYSRVYAHEPLPSSASDFDMLVVLGGPQSPTTTRAECPHFDAAAECALIRQAVDAERAVVGVCLGAQLIGTALGAPHAHSPEKEIGVFPITLTAAGQAHPMFAGFPQTLLTGHWHSDMPGLTPTAQVLASSEGCPRQIIAYGPRVYGFQCHMEFTPQVVALLIDETAGDFAALTGHRFVQQPPALLANDYSEMNRLLFSFLDALASATQQRQA